MTKQILECNGIAAGYVKGLNILQGVDLVKEVYGSKPKTLEFNLEYLKVFDDAKKKATQILTYLNLEHRMDHRPAKLSGVITTLCEPAGSVEATMIFISPVSLESGKLKARSAETESASAAIIPPSAIDPFAVTTLTSLIAR